KFLEVEIDMWYYGILNKHWEKFARTIQQTKQDAVKAMAELMSAFKVTEDMVKEVFEKLKLDKEKIILWTEKDVMAIAVEFRKRTKPMVIAANKVDVPGAQEKLKALQEKFSSLTIIPCSGESELALKEAAKHGLIDYIPGEGSFKITDKGNASLNDNQKKALDFIQKNILDKFGSTGIQQVLDKAVFDVLGYIHIFPGGVNKLADQFGNIMPDCFLLPPGSTALDFAYAVHTDLGKRFIRAIDAKTKKTVGKEHPLKAGDVLEIVAGK
ncbi:MAG: TGS domain-containing protein, partial [Nanoarchaeota archaeon]|nr:TGS domain-containing protein [Nanoarchaeota archaeon]